MSCVSCTKWNDECSKFPDNFPKTHTDLCSSYSPIKPTRAWKAGVMFASGIISMVHLMYQNKTAINYLKGLDD